MLHCVKIIYLLIRYLTSSVLLQFNMLMRLQEAANYSGNQSCESDTNSLDSVGMSNEDISQEVAAVQ